MTRRVVRFWKPEEDAKLRELYRLSTNVELTRVFDRSIASIQGRASFFGLRKAAVARSRAARDRLAARRAGGELSF